METWRGRLGARVRRGIGLVMILLLGAAAWLPAMHLVFEPRLSDYLSPTGLPPAARAIAARHLAIWADPARRAVEVNGMRASNAEWDFMARTFFVLSLGNIALREPALKAQCVSTMDTIIDETLRLESEKGMHYFLMSYSHSGPFVAKGGRSLFEDGEISLMLAVRRLVGERRALQPLLAARVERMNAQMRESPVLSGESYPNECWTFCNSIGLAAMRAEDALDGTDHSAFIHAWLSTARRSLVDSKTGLLVSSFTQDGQPLDGPEGSSIWTAAHFLSLVDRDFAADQYRRAKRELSGRVVGFGYAREWPASWVGVPDIDSGPIIPGLDISLGSSGQALLGAATFGDREYAGGLITSLNFGGFPTRSRGELRYAASNTVGDALVLYALVQGPLWGEIRQRGKEVR